MTDDVVREPSRIQEVLGPDLFARLTEPSGDSTAPTDDRGGAAARAQWLTGVVSDLSGTYSSTGIRAWFDRPRSQLEGRSPCEVLGDDWGP